MRRRALFEGLLGCGLGGRPSEPIVVMELTIRGDVDIDALLDELVEAAARRCVRRRKEQHRG